MTGSARAAVAFLLVCGCTRGGGDAPGGEAPPPGKPATSYVDVIRAGCDKGIAHACNDLGIALFDGSGVARDPQKAAAAYRRACDLGDALGCVNLGVMLLNGQGIPSDPAAAAEFFRVGCLAGDHAACANLGLLLVEGRGVARDPDRGKALLGRSCQAGFADACKLLQGMGSP
jgi:TPR repeat protein